MGFFGNALHQIGQGIVKAGNIAEHAGESVAHKVVDETRAVGAALQHSAPVQTLEHVAHLGESALKSAAHKVESDITQGAKAAEHFAEGAYAEGAAVVHAVEHGGQAVVDEVKSGVQRAEQVAAAVYNEGAGVYTHLKGDAVAVEGLFRRGAADVGGLLDGITNFFPYLLIGGGGLIALYIVTSQGGRPASSRRKRAASP